jgi:hypothetical protein
MPEVKSKQVWEWDISDEIVTKQIEVILEEKVPLLVAGLINNIEPAKKIVSVMTCEARELLLNRRRFNSLSPFHIEFQRNKSYQPTTFR